MSLNAVIEKQTKFCTQWGYCDFTGQFNPDTHEQVAVDADFAPADTTGKWLTVGVVADQSICAVREMYAHERAAAEQVLLPLARWNACVAARAATKLQVAEYLVDGFDVSQLREQLEIKVANIMATTTLVELEAIVPL